MNEPLRDNMLHERVAKLEVVTEQLDEKTSHHASILAKLDDDMVELRNDIRFLGSKMDNGVLKALDSVPPWIAKQMSMNNKIVIAVVSALVTITCAALGMRYIHGI